MVSVKGPYILVQIPKRVPLQEFSKEKDGFPGCIRVFGVFLGSGS